MKNNDSFLRASLPLFLFLAAFSISLHLFLSIIVTVISNQKLQVSLPPARSVCLSDFIDRRPAVSLFGSERFTSTILACLSLTPLRAPSFANRCGSLVWHRSVRSNLINSCKFNYWLTAPRLRALYLLLASPRASISSCSVFLFFFHPPFSLSPRTANKPISAFAVFAKLSSAFSFSAELCGGNAIARKW